MLTSKSVCLLPFPIHHFSQQVQKVHKQTIELWINSTFSLPNMCLIFLEILTQGEKISKPV